MLTFVITVQFLPIALLIVYRKLLLTTKKKVVMQILRDISGVSYEELDWLKSILSALIASCWWYVGMS